MVFMIEFAAENGIPIYYEEGALSPDVMIQGSG